MKKFTSKKPIAILSLVVASICLVGVGFSSWVIENMNTTDSTEIGIGVGGVETELLTIADLTLNDGDIYLDASKGDDVAPIKHSADDSGKFEDLELSFSFKIPQEQYSNFNGLHYRLVDKTAESTLSTFLKANENLLVMPGMFTAESSKGLNYAPLVLPTMINSDGEITTGQVYYYATQSTSTTVSDSENYNVSVAVSAINATQEKPAYFKYDVTMLLKWGSKFGGVNPSRYGEGVSATLDANFATAEAVIAAIETLQDNINGKSFLIEISHFTDKVATIN